MQADRGAVLILKARDVILRFDCLCLITANFHEFSGLFLTTPGSGGEIHVHMKAIHQPTAPTPHFLFDESHFWEHNNLHVEIS